VAFLPIRSTGYWKGTSATFTSPLRFVYGSPAQRLKMSIERPPARVELVGSKAALACFETVARLICCCLLGQPVVADGERQVPTERRPDGAAAPKGCSWRERAIRRNSTHE
jgi:hypothetical protein